MSLPKGFKQLEYIQSSGSQYVDSDYYANQDTRLVIDFDILKQSALDYVFGARSAGNTAMYELAVQGSAWYSGYGNANVQPSFSGLDRYVVDKNKNATTINGVTSTATANTFETAYTVKLFALDNVGTIGFYATMKLYSCQIYDNGTLVRDFIPCQNASGAVGLWDSVNEVFYGNAGTGTFTAGPEVVIALDAPASVEQVLSVKLTWSAVENASFYRIYRDGVQIGETEALIYADDTATFGQTYIYGITACSGSSESDPTELTVYTREGYAVIRPVVTSANFP